MSGVRPCGRRCLEGGSGRHHAVFDEVPKLHQQLSRYRHHRLSLGATAAPADMLVVPLRRPAFWLPTEPEPAKFDHQRAHAWVAAL